MDIRDAVSEARQKAADALGCDVDSLNDECKKRGLSFTYKMNGSPRFDLERRIDTYSPDDVALIWSYLDDGARLYFDSLRHTANVEAMADTEKLYAVEAWYYFWSLAKIGELRLDETQDSQQILDGSALYRAGYYIRYSDSANELIGGAQLSGNPIIVERRGAGYVAMNPMYRLVGLYSRDIVEADEAVSTLNDVMTAAEVADEYGIDHGTIRVSIHKGYIPARKSGGTWLIRRVDAEARWGKK